MDEEILVSKSLLKFIYSILDKFDYEQPDDGDFAEFKGEVSLDWFYGIKHDLERILNK